MLLWALTNGKFRIDTDSSVSYTFSGPSTYKIEMTANTNPGAQVSGTVGSLVPGATYYFRVWSADDLTNWSTVSNGATNYSGVDTTAPSAVTALSAATGVNAGQIRLSWVSPGDDGTTGTATSFTIKFASSPDISPAGSDVLYTAAQNLNSTSPVPSSQVYATYQTMIVTGLQAGVTYYFAMKSQDAGGNVSLLSNGATAWTQNSSADVTAPSDITNLAAQTGVNTGEIALTWIAPGNDGNSGDNVNGASYQLKYATYSVSGGANSSTTTWWNNASLYSQSWPVGARGASESRTAVLTAGVTYYFGIKTADAAGNGSNLDTKASSATAGSGILNRRKTALSPATL